jgi:hypothetical protein
MLHPPLLTGFARSIPSFSARHSRLPASTIVRHSVILSAAARVAARGLDAVLQRARVVVLAPAPGEGLQARRARLQPAAASADSTAALASLQALSRWRLAGAGGRFLVERLLQALQLLRRGARLAQGDQLGLGLAALALARQRDRGVDLRSIFLVDGLASSQTPHSRASASSHQRRRIGSRFGGARPAAGAALPGAAPGVARRARGAAAACRAAPGRGRRGSRRRSAQAGGRRQPPAAHPADRTARGAPQRGRRWRRRCGVPPLRRAAALRLRGPAPRTEVHGPRRGAAPQAG